MGIVNRMKAEKMANRRDLEARLSPYTVSCAPGGDQLWPSESPGYGNVKNYWVRMFMGSGWSIRRGTGEIVIRSNG